MASFKNPLGEVVERDESEIFSFDGVDSHKAIDKGGREFPDVGVSQGCGVDCRSNRGRRPPRTEHFRLVGCGSGLHPRQDKCLETRGAGEGGDHDSATPDTAKASSDGAYRPDAAELEQAKKEAWEKAKAALRGPTNWTQYWNAARKAEGNTGLPKWLVALNSNQRLPAFTGFGSIPKPQMLTTYEDFQPDSYRYVTPRPSDWIANLDPGVRDSIQVPGPLQITPGQWANLLPSERQGLQGLVESQGGSFDDWAATLRRGWPQWNRSPRTRFGGGF